jgi:hypothetical protein
MQDVDLALFSLIRAISITIMLVVAYVLYKKREFSLMAFVATAIFVISIYEPAQRDAYNMKGQECRR